MTAKELQEALSKVNPNDPRTNTVVEIVKDVMNATQLKQKLAARAATMPKISLTSSLMYNEVPGYKNGDWRKYSIHDNNNIKGFFGEYRWLSNFELCNAEYMGMMYPSSENAYQAAKVYEEYRALYQNCTPSESKRLNRIHMKESLPMFYSNENWDIIREKVMEEILRAKFWSDKNPDLSVRLQNTGAKYLEETNHWNDTFWGVNCNTGKGQNTLGKLLMKIRTAYSQY